MGIKDFFSSEGRQRRRVESLTGKLCDRYGPSEERWSAADQLAEIATDDAVYGMIRRFLAVSDKIAEDREEKRHVQDLLVQLGAKAMPSIRSFIRREADAVLAVECLRRMQSGDALVHELIAILHDVGPHAARPDQITPVLAAMAEIKDTSGLEAALPYLEAYDDAIRLAAIDYLAKLGDQRAKEPFLSIANNEDTSPRIKERILQALDIHGWLPKNPEKKKKK